jgi:inosine/xanthosine triphosphatase
MKIICVGSNNPVKILVVKNGFLALFPEMSVEVIGYDAISNVSYQPLSSDETLHGARNRATYVRDHHPEADFWVGVEGGIEIVEKVMQEFTWVVVLAKNGKEGLSRSTSFTIPTAIATLIHTGMEHGPAADHVFGVNNSKQTDGTIGLISDNIMTRASYIQPAVTSAFLVFKNPDYFM